MTAGKTTWLQQMPAPNKIWTLWPAKMVTVMVKTENKMVINTIYIRIEIMSCILLHLECLFQHSRCNTEKDKRHA